MACPSFLTRSNISGCLEILSPMQKKVALQLKLFKVFKTKSVTTGMGPSSKVK